MKSTYSIKEAQTQLPALVRRAEAGSLTTITRHEKPVAYVLSAERMEAMLETMELLADPAFMQEWRKAQAGKLKYEPLSALDG
ncbi:MAG: type II toxin-antitoxin system prevent-host-death family antitoxin [Opitutales bacterium]|jgi:antitoxin YefM